MNRAAARFISNMAKAETALIPYQGEIAWQNAGSPGRQSFEPLQHLGNMGLGSAYGIVSGIFINIGLSVIEKSRLPDEQISAEQRARDAISWKERMHKKVTLPAALAICTVPQIYSETIGSGTHDSLDAIYGVGSSAAALAIYNQLKRWDFRHDRERLDEIITENSFSEKPQRVKQPSAHTDDFIDTGLPRKERRKLAAQARLKAKKHF
jgi:hypothetical protein